MRSAVLSNLTEETFNRLPERKSNGSNPIGERSGV